jgi:energy-coupling factor transporter ATP-binding protein EcfA2
MKVSQLRAVGIRCFADTGDIHCDPRFNLFVGVNNSGKTSLLKVILALQQFPIEERDLRIDVPLPFWSVLLTEVRTEDAFSVGRSGTGPRVRILMHYRNGQLPEFGGQDEVIIVNPGHKVLPNFRPLHKIVPFLARRKAAEYSHDVSLQKQRQVDGTFSSLYSRIDLLATSGHPDSDVFRDAVDQITGLPITTKASDAGKQAGVYFNGDTFVTLDQMGDGITEMVALIVELCTERNKIFVLEEPETSLHPRGLRALLNLVRKAAECNQFFIATHSNIVLRELGGGGEGKVSKHRNQRR